MRTGAGQDAELGNDQQVLWHLHKDLSVVRGAADALAPLLVRVLQGLRS